MIAAIALALIYAIFFGPGYVALNMYKARLSTSRTAAFDAKLYFYNPGYLSVDNSDFNISGAYDRSNHANPQSDLSFSGILGGKQYDGQADTRDGVLYFNAAGPQLPVVRYKQSSFIYQIQPGWNQVRHDRDLFSWYCETRPDSRQPGPEYLDRVIGKLSFINPRLVSMNEQLGDRTAAHYRGVVDSGSLIRAVDKFNAEAPEGCALHGVGLELNLVKVTYDLWTGQDFDRLVISANEPASQSAFSFALDTSAYNQPVVFTPPPPALDLNAIFAASSH